MAPSQKQTRPALMALSSGLTLALLLTMAGCATSNLAPSRPVSYTPTPPVSYSPRTPQGSHVTLASWYGPGFSGRRTSSGEIFRPNELTAASKTLPLGSYVRVTNLRNGKSVTVRINDRGPYVRGRGIDLSHAAAKKVGLSRAGVAPVRISGVDEAAAAPDVRPVEWRAPVHERYKRYRHRYRHREIHDASLGNFARDPMYWVVESLR